MSLWRLIGDSDLDGPLNMASDEALLLSFKDLSDARGSSKEVLPVFRFYGWQEVELSLGYSQDFSSFENLDIPIVRRPTGGKAVLHLPKGGELTYSITCPRDSYLYKVGIKESYCQISKAFNAAFHQAGVEVDFSKNFTGQTKSAISDSCFATLGIQEATVGGRKLVGSAQRRYSWGFLQQGSIVIGRDVSLYESIFGSGSGDSFCGLGEFSSITKEELKNQLLESFSELFKCSFERTTYTDEELLVRESLLENKYGSESWTVDKKLQNYYKTQVSQV